MQKRPSGIKKHKEKISNEGKMLEVITIRVVLNDASYAVKENPWKKRVFVNAEKLEFKDGEFFVKSATPIHETNIRTDI